MMRDRRLLVAAAIAIAALQIGFLFSMIASRAAILRSGQVVELRVLPVDPRDLLRGDYVILDYTISSLETALLVEPPEAESGVRDRTVYVRLEPGEDGIWQAVSARLDRPVEPAPRDGQVDIRGDAKSGLFPGSRVFTVDYGIERYYVPEGEGRAIEDDMLVRPFTVRVAVASDGSAQIKSFHDGDKMLYAEPLY